jgi:hypothetical protein
MDGVVFVCVCKDFGVVRCVFPEIRIWKSDPRKILGKGIYGVFICKKFLFLVRLAAKMPIRACPADGVLL